MTNLTIPVTLNLLRTSALQAALELVGYRWEPEVRKKKVLRAGYASLQHLYMWGVGKGTDIGGLYIGIDESWDGHRIRKELSMAKTTNVHGHALAVQRTDAKVVSAPLIEQPLDFAWLEPYRSDEDIALWSTHWADLREQPRPLRLAEQFAVRFSIFAGDTGVPVNSEHKGAWDWSEGKSETVNRLAEAAAQHLRAQA